MTNVRFRNWLLETDADATREAYARARSGGSEDCSCDHCRNFIAARALVYPDEVRNLFGRLGVDPEKEGEAYWTHRTADGLHHYGGWFHFVGAVIAGPPCRVETAKDLWEYQFVEVEPHFSIGFDSKGNAPRLEPLRDANVVQIDFTACVPWTCDRPEPS